jgi:pantoate--beta-alanine ligase
MLIARTVLDLRARVAELRAGGRTVGIVPTMGALHAGHLELIRRARLECDAVVLSIFVNPAQFDDQADLIAYPRTEEADLQLAQAAGVDLAFIPGVAEVYPAGFSAAVTLRGPMVETFEGAERGSSHFAGVTTVVSKLFNMVGADRAYFGQKDAQQLHVVRAMVADLNIDVEVVAVPTVREPDGIALSSRNIRLTPRDRTRAVEISRALNAALAEYRTGTRTAADLLSVAGKVLASAGIVPEYLAAVDQSSFAAVDQLAAPALIVIAARIGDVRLIDNVVLDPA